MPRRRPLLSVLTGVALLGIMVYWLRPGTRTQPVPVATASTVPALRPPATADERGPVTDSTQLATAAPVQIAPTVVLNPGPAGPPADSTDSTPPAAVSHPLEIAGDLPSLPALEQTLRFSQRATERLQAVKALREMGRNGDADGRIRATLRQAMNDADPEVGVNARDAFQELDP